MLKVYLCFRSSVKPAQALSSYESDHPVPTPDRGFLLASYMYKLQFGLPRDVPSGSDGLPVDKAYRKIYQLRRAGNCWPYQ